MTFLYFEHKGEVYQMLESQNFPKLVKTIFTNIQAIIKDIIKKNLI